MTALFDTGNGDVDGVDDVDDVDISIGYGALGGMVVAPDGSITYDFQGHLAARGLDLVAAPFPAGQTLPENSVTWLRQSDGAAIARMTSTDFGDMRYDTVGPAGVAEHLLRVTDLSSNLMAFELDSDRAQVWAQATNTPGGFAAMRLLDALGQSDALRVRNPTRYRAIFGYINSNGTVGVAGSGDWTPGSHGVNGVYNITWSPAIAAGFMVSLTPVGTNRFVTVSSFNTSGATVYFTTTINGGALDTPFTFLAVAV